MRSLTLVVAASLFLTAGRDAAAQNKQRLFEIEGVGGFNVVDVEKWSGASGSSLNDWSQAVSGLNARLFFGNAGRARVGVEWGWQYLLWYELRLATGGGSFSYPDYEASAQHLSAIFRFEQSPRLAFDLGGGMHFFDGFTDPGLHLGMKYRIVDKPSFSIPLGLRVDPILDSDAMMIPVAITLGWSKRF